MTSTSFAGNGVEHPLGQVLVLRGTSTGRGDSRSLAGSVENHNEISGNPQSISAAGPFTLLLTPLALAIDGIVP
jgi:hypothetical protein